MDTDDIVPGLAGWSGVRALPLEVLVTAPYCGVSRTSGSKVGVSLLLLSHRSCRAVTDRAPKAVPVKPTTEAQVA